MLDWRELQAQLDISELFYHFLLSQLINQDVNLFDTFNVFYVTQNTKGSKDGLGM